MNLRDRMVYAGIQNSRAMAQLTWFQRDFFRGLIHAADDYGRFEADATLLRAVLYGLLTSKVSVRDVQDAMTRCHQIGLVKLYTQNGRGYGKVINFRQTLQKRRALYPDEEGGPPEPELFTTTANAASASERKKEEKSPLTPRPAGGDDSFSFESRTTAEARPRRVRRLPSLDTLKDDLATVESEMTSILHPGGCAYKVAPTGEKAARFEKLAKERTTLLSAIKRTRAALEQGDAS